MAGEFLNSSDFDLHDFDSNAGSFVAGSNSILPVESWVSRCTFDRRGDHQEELVVGDSPPGPPIVGSAPLVAHGL